MFLVWGLDLNNQAGRACAPGDDWEISALMTSGHFHGLCAPRPSAPSAEDTHLIEVSGGQVSHTSHAPTRVLTLQRRGTRHTQAAGFDFYRQ